MKNYLLVPIILLFVTCTTESAEKNPTTHSENSEFIWDFSTKKKFVYSYSQTVNGANKSAENSLPDKSFDSVEGFLNIRVKDSNLADLSLVELNSKQVVLDDEGKPTGDTISNEVPATIIPDMNENGRFLDQNANIMFDILFPLPSKDLKLGESNNIPMQMPFNTNGTRLFSKGFNTLRFEGFETIKERKCAVIKGKIDISELDIPEELKGEYGSKTTGNATYYFDLENHYYVGADIKLVMEILMDFGTEDKNDIGMYTELISENTIKVRLEKIEE